MIYNKSVTVVFLRYKYKFYIFFYWNKKKRDSRVRDGRNTPLETGNGNKSFVRHYEQVLLKHKYITLSNDTFFSLHFSGQKIHFLYRFFVICLLCHKWTVFCSYFFSAPFLIITFHGQFVLQSSTFSRTSSFYDWEQFCKRSFSVIQYMIRYIFVNICTL